MTMEKRIVELEIKLSFSEDALEQLNMTIFRQQRQIEELQRDLRALRQQVGSAAPNEPPRSLRDEIPPHY